MNKELCIKVGKLNILYYDARSKKHQKTKKKKSNRSVLLINLEVTDVDQDPVAP